MSYKKSKIGKVFIDPGLLISPFVEVRQTKSGLTVDLNEYNSIKY